MNRLDDCDENCAWVKQAVAAHNHPPIEPLINLARVKNTQNHIGLAIFYVVTLALMIVAVWP